MTQTETLSVPVSVSVDSVLKCSRATKDQILAVLLREKIAEQPNGIPFPIEDEKGESIGILRPAWERSTVPPPMTPEHRAALQEAINTPEKSFTFEEFLLKHYPEDFRSLPK